MNSKVRQYYCPMSKNGSSGVKCVLEMGNWGQSPQTLSNVSEFREKLGISKSFGYYFRVFESYLIKKMLNFESQPKEQFAQSLERPSYLMVKTKACFKACKFGFPSDFDKWGWGSFSSLKPIITSQGYY